MLPIPELTKDALSYDQENILVENYSKRLSKKTTGGSTGQAVTVLKDNISMVYEDAAMWRALRWHGIDIGDKQARFWGIPMENSDKIKNKLIDFAMNRIRLSAFNFNDQSMELYYNKIKKYQPAYFYGYVSMIKEFVQFCEINKLDLTQLNLKGVVTTSEPLFPETKNYMHENLNCPIINDYGSGEVGPIAYSCPDGGFHLMADNLYIEIINKNGNHAKTGEEGQVVVTEVNNYAMPMIRYNLKDVAIVTDEQCSCGRGLPLIKTIIGRNKDLLFTEDGKKVHGAYIGYIAQQCKQKHMGLKQYQVVQDMPNNIVFNIIIDEGYTSKTDTYITLKLQEKLGKTMNIRINKVETIEREKSGKLRVVKCNIPF